MERHGGNRRTTWGEPLTSSNRLAGRCINEGTDGIYRRIKAAAEDADFDPRRVHPHLLRATAITRMCNSGMHPAMVSEITGVSVAVIARHYHHPVPEDVWESAMKALDS